MLYTPNYNLSKAEGTDTVNLLTQNYPNFDIIDTAMKANADAGITLATETKTGTNHALVRANTGAAVLRFVATSNYAAGDTFTVDTTVVTAVLPSGQSLPAGAFVINSTVLAILVGTQLTVLASAGSSDAETLEGHSASYFATAGDLQELSDTLTDDYYTAAEVDEKITERSLIWTNNSKSAMSGETEISISELSSYKYIEIVLWRSTSDSIDTFVVIPGVLTNSDINYVAQAITSDKMTYRNIRIRPSINKITVSDGYIINSIGSHGSNNEICVPAKIYGYK